MSELLDKINQTRIERAERKDYVVIMCAYGGMTASKPMKMDDARAMVDFYTMLNAPAIMTQVENAGAVIRALHIANKLAITPDCNKYYKGEREVEHYGN